MLFYRVRWKNRCPMQGKLDNLWVESSNGNSTRNNDVLCHALTRDSGGGLKNTSNAFRYVNSADRSTNFDFFFIIITQ